MIIPAVVDFDYGNRNEYPVLPRVVAVFLCLLVPLVSHLARRGLKRHRINNHHRTSDVWCRFITQVNSKLLREVPQYDLRKRHFWLPKSGEFADINNHQSIGALNKTIPVEAEDSLFLNIR